MNRWRGTATAPSRTSTRTDGLVTGATLLAMLVAVSVRTGSFVWPDGRLWALTLLAWAPLLVRTRWPLAALAATVAVSVVHLLVVPVPADAAQTAFMGAYQPVPIATMVAAWTLATRTGRAPAWAAGGGSALVLVVVAVAARSDELLATDMVMANLVLIATGLGALVAGRREQRERDARDRAESLREAVTDERLRIARELHDVLAHNLVLVNAQAGVAEYLLRTDPDRAQTALRDIADHTRRAVDDLRSTVGLLRRDGTDDDAHELAPVPGLARLPELVESVAATGTPVEVVETGTPAPLGEHADLAAYRIVQESLTNAGKHAPGGAVSVTLTWSSDGLDLRIENRPAPRPAPRAAGTGHGLLGMRERARAAGGTLDAHPTPDGGFVVHTVLPALVSTAS